MNPREPEWIMNARARALWERRGSRPRPMRAADFAGRRVLTLESRRAPELALLIVNYGGEPVVAPALKEVPLESNTEAVAFAHALARGDIDILVLMTGVGTRLLVDAALPVVGRDGFIDLLRGVKVISRGPKSVAALREMGVEPWLAAPKPNTWREVLAVLDATVDRWLLRGARVAVQEYGVSSPELVTGLWERGAHVRSVPIYRWALPDDLGPLQTAVRAIVEDGIDAVMLTAPVQLQHLLQAGEMMGLDAELRRGLNRLVLASIGPMTSEEIRRQGLVVGLEATNAKMGVLVKEAAEQWLPLLNTRRMLGSTA